MPPHTPVYHEMVEGPLDGDVMASARSPEHDTIFIAGLWVYCFDVRRSAWVFLGYKKTKGSGNADKSGKGIR